ncbi:glycosyltransferase family 4 protein [Azonexus sp. IMCC34842]|uniref:glycosyltransferase family 4 protein n=1 Tax=Azonexus sp. IMCC34842 TaxID=3420950 RepID=UPI003D10E43F
MRVLILSQYFWPETFRITEVAIALRDAGCEVLVLTGQPNYPDGEIFNGYSACSIGAQVHQGIEVLRVPLVPRGPGSAIRLAINYLSFVFSAAVFGPWVLRGRSIDAILVFAPSPILQVIPAIWLAWLKKASLVTWVQDLWPESLSATGFVKNKILLEAVSTVVRWIYRRNDVLLVQSEAFEASVRKMAGGTPVVYHPNPGDFAFSNPRDTESLVSYGPGFNIVFAGNLGTVQSLDTVLQAANILRYERDVSFILIGSGSRSEWLHGEIARLGLDNVKLPGRFPPSAMPTIMEKASVLLVSLIRSPIMNQTVPSKLQAYFAAGKPVIASLDGEGARIVKKADAGLTCPAEDALALAEAVKQLRDTPKDRLDCMGKNACKFYQENFEPRMLAARLMTVLLDLKRGLG